MNEQEPEKEQEKDNENEREHESQHEQGPDLEQVNNQQLENELEEVYKERQGIHIHRKEEENEEKLSKEENLEEKGKIHPVEPVINEEKQAEENQENKEEEEVEEEQEHEDNQEQEEEAQNEKEDEKENLENTHEIKTQPIDNKSKRSSQEPDKISHITEKKKRESKKEEIPKIMVFKKPKEEQSLEFEEKFKEINQKKINYKSFVEITKEEAEKNADIETIVLKGGIESGEYKFQGEETEMSQVEPLAQVKINKEEILNEINERNKKEKKISLELVDKYYSLALYEEKKVEVSNEQKEKEENKNEINAAILNDNFSKYLLEQINKIRADPQSFIGIIEDAKDNIKKDRHGKYYYNGNKIKVALREGESAFDETIEFLKSCQPMNPLNFSQELIPTPPKNEDEVQDRNYLRKRVQEMMYKGIRINSYWRDVIKDAEICFLLMIVDDNGSNKGLKRNDILCPGMKNIGVSSVEINGKFVNYFILSQ